jgi:UDP-glucose 4-epimerase
MRICITGGLGVIGSWITRTIVQKGMRPVVISRNKDLTLVPDCVGKFDFFPCDIQDSAAINKILKQEKIEGLIHAAAMGNLGTAEQNPLEAIRVNGVGTAVVMEAAGAQNLKTVIYLSSGSIYDQSGKSAQHNKLVIDEDFAIRPKDISKITKWFGEEIGRYFAKRYSFQFAAIRSSAMYAPVKQSHKAYVPTHSLLLENAAQGLPTIVSRQESMRVGDWIYVADLAEGVVSACLSKHLNHDAYNLGSGQAITVREFAEAVRKVFPLAKIEIASENNDSETDARRDRVFDISRARQDLNFRPRHDALSGIGDYRRMLEIFNS